jgi:[ribosomal protein S18]-alanine N-acetyltransferase
MSTVTQTELQFVPMRSEHVASVLDVENRVYPQPWTPSMFLSELDQPAKCDYTVAMAGDSLVGYTGLNYVDDEAHVTTIAVDPLFQGTGIATALMKHNVQLCLSRGIKAMTLEVRVSNEPAKKLYQRFGFAPVGVRKRYYSNPTEDALIMWVYDIDSKAYAERSSRMDEELSWTK